MLYRKRTTILLFVIVLLSVITLVSTTQDSDETDAVYFIGQHHVASWPVWLEVFHEVQSFRDTFGNVSNTNEVFRSHPHRNYITVFEPFPDIENAMGWASSPELWQAVIRGSSDSPLRVYLNTLVESQTPAEGNATLLLEQFIVDYDAWYGAFGPMETARMENGGTGYRIFRDADYPNHVTVALDFDSISSAEAFQSSETYTAFTQHDVHIAMPINLLLEPSKE